MQYNKPPDIRRGQRLKATRLNYDEEGIRRAQVVSGDGVTVSSSRMGSSVTVDGVGAFGTTTFWIRIIGGDGSGRYSWHQIIATPTLTDRFAWSDASGNGVSGTTTRDPAVEANGFTLLTAGTRIEVRRDAVTNQIRFQLESCP